MVPIIIALFAMFRATQNFHLGFHLDLGSPSG